MKVIRFKVFGILNSFRIPFFRTYHKSFLAPPKTTIIGMITNILGKPEQCFYNILENSEIDISVVINSIAGRAKDLWAYKTLENKSGMHGRSVVRRDKLFQASYTIYLSIQNKELQKEIYQVLKCPKNIPSLGLDDEIITISDVEEVELEFNDSRIIDSVFMDKGYSYKAVIKDVLKQIEFPTGNMVPLSFSINENNESKRTTRASINELKQIEFLNCEIHFEDIESYTDGINRVVFY